MNTVSPDVIIIGAGVIGLSCALRLRQAGCNVRVYERGLAGRESSWAGAGIIEFGSLARTDPLALLRRASCGIYPAFMREIQELSGIDPEFIRCGTIDLITDQNQARAAQRELQAQGASLPNEIPGLERLDAAGLRAAEPNISAEFQDALLIRRDAQARNPRVIQALLGACRALGVGVCEHRDVATVSVSGGRVLSVTIDGESVSAERYLLAAGAMSSAVHPAFETLLPVHPVRGQIVLLDHPAPLFSHVLRCGRHYLVPRRDGHILAGSTEEHDSGFDRRTTAGGVSRILQAAERVVPALREAAVLKTWAGLRPGSRDGRPYLGPVPGFDGLLAATGHFRSGVTLAPITAQLVREWICGEPPSFDSAAFRPGRAFVAPPADELESIGRV